VATVAEWTPWSSHGVTVVRGVAAAKAAAGGEASGMDPVVKPRGDGCGVVGCD